MARRKREIKRKEIGVDAVYGSDLLQKFINVLMERGKKHVASRIVYEALDVLSKKVGAGDNEKTIEFFNKAFWQIVPVVEVRSRRVGGSVYQIPREVTRDRGRALAMRWIIEAAATRSGRTMGARLANELLDAVEGRGSAIKKKLDVHKMAEANRAFSHYAW
jgi:small subunit ribosomal protein S7